ncbi:MAG: hypothetical protein RIB58_02220 [Phycisphaerales bacterium]
MSQSTRVPRRLSQFVPWIISRVDLWNGGQSGPPDIGLSSQQLADLTALRDDFVQKYNDAQAARDLSKARTILQHEAYDELRAVLGGDIDIIDGYAKATGDAGVYARAQLPPPKDATPRETAPVPASLELRNTTNGNLVLSFEANKGQGATFLIQRRYKVIGSDATQYDLVASVAQKTWTDLNVPTGLEWIGYQVATRLTNGVTSDWSTQETFYFGPVSGEASGGQTVTIEDAQKLKDAQTAKGAEKAG